MTTFGGGTSTTTLGAGAFTTVGDEHGGGFGDEQS